MMTYEQASALYNLCEQQPSERGKRSIENIMRMSLIELLDWLNEMLVSFNNDMDEIFSKPLLSTRHAQ